MTSQELHRLPRSSKVIREQLEVTALSLRIPSIVVAGLAALATILAVTDFMRGRGGVEFAPALSLIPAFAGALLPVAIWQGEKRFGTGLLWTLPVSRTHHAVAKILAGWLLLMIAVTGFVLWLLILALITKGNITGDEIIRLLPTSDIPPAGTLDRSLLRTVRSVSQPILWLVPFFAATGTYALSSAIWLGLRYPFRWIIGAIAGLFLIAAVSQGIESEKFWLLTGRFVNALFEGRYGLDALLSARTRSLETLVRLTDGSTVSVWRGLPAASDWIIATLLWTGLGLASLSAAIMRHRERR